MPGRFALRVGLERECLRAARLTPGTERSLRKRHATAAIHQDDGRRPRAIGRIRDKDGRDLSLRREVQADSGYLLVRRTPLVMQKVQERVDSDIFFLQQRYE